MIKIFISDFRSKIELQKLKCLKATKSNLVAYETLKHKEAIKGYTTCLTELDKLVFEYETNNKLKIDNIETFYYDLLQRYISSINTYLEGEEKHSFKTLKRSVWGYYNSINKCIKALKKHFKAFMKE